MLCAALAAMSIPAGAQQEVVTDSLGRGLGVYTNPAMLLQGRISGVRVSATDGAPGGLVNTNIRGINSVRGSGEPLWIVDGAILSSSNSDTFQLFDEYGNSAFTAPVSQLDGLNVYDIESIEVLKNTSATAIYGSRGANGVIIVKTRNPEVGKMSVMANTNAALSIPSGYAHNHNVAIGSSTGRTIYRLSAFFRDMNGVLSTSGNQAFGARMKFETQSNKVVWFGLNTSFTVGRINSSTGAAWYGMPSAALEYRGISPLAYNDIDGVSSPEGWDADYSDLASVTRSTTSFYLTLNFTKSLRWKNSVSFDMQDSKRGIWYGSATPFGHEVNCADGITYSSLFTLDYKSELSYDRYFGTKHHLSLLGAFEYLTDWNKFNLLAGTNFFMEDLRVEGFNLKESANRIRYIFPDLESIGGHFRIDYDYGKVFGIEAVGRYETAPQFDSGRAFNENLYPAASAWLDLRRIAFSNSEALSALRIDGGWGLSGRNRYIPYELLGYYSGIYPSVNAEQTGYYKGYNRILGKEWHVGVNAAFLSDRIEASIAYYDRTSTDNLNIYCFGKPSTKEIGVWESTDRFSVQEQESVIQNSGVELDLNFVPVKTNSISWTVGLNAAYNMNRLLTVSAADAKGLSLNSDKMFANMNLEGESVSSLYGFTTDADNTVNGEGVLGNTIPKIMGGFNTELNMYGFRLELAGNAAAGFKVLNMNRMLASAKIETYMGESVAQPFAEDGDFFRLSRATFGYRIPVKSSKIKTLDVSLTGTNLFTLTRYSGLNPDADSFGFTNMARGLDYGTYPLARCFMLGIAAKF